MSRGDPGHHVTAWRECHNKQIEKQFKTIEPSTALWGSYSQENIRLVQSNGYQDKTNQNDGYEKKQLYVENYCNLAERPPSTEADPTYATIEESKYHSCESLYKWKETYLDQSTTNGLYNGVSSSVADQTVPQEKSFIQSQSAWSQYSHGSEDEYTSHLRNSSYAMLKTPGENNIFHSMGPKSMLQVNQEKFSGKSNHGIKHTSKFQSLPYIGSQVLSQVSGKSDDVNELEEYAKKYEAIQRQSSRRTSASTTPIIDQLRRESQQTSFWSQALHGSETDMSGRESVITTSSSIPTNTSPNGRESVTSAKSDSSGETLRGDMTQLCQSSGNTSKSTSPCHRSQHHEYLQNHENYKPDNTRRTRSSQKLSYVPFSSASLKPMSNELTESTICTRTKPILYGSSDNRRKSDFYSLSDYRGFYKQPDLHGEEKPGHQPPAVASRENNLQSNSSMADESDFCPVANPLQPPSVNDRINQIEQFARTTKQRSEDDYHLSKSVPNLVSENAISSQNESVESLDNDRYHAQPNYTYLDPEKKMKVTDNTLKLIQKQAVLEYYERQKKSSVDLTKEEKSTSPKIESQDNIEDSKNVDQHKRFLRSISQGSLTLSYPSSESEIMSHTNTIGKRSPSQSSLSSTRTSNSETPSTPLGAQHNGMLDPHKIDFQQDVSSNFNTKMIESCSKLESGFSNLHGHHQAWKSKKENKPEILVEKNNSFTNGHYKHMSRLTSNLETTRTPSPELPPPPPEEEAEVLCNDEPLPPPPLRIDEENDKCNPLNEENKIGNISKRNSPATIAAKGAPGWDKFLGGNTSNVSFTSDEARKFRRTKDRHRARANDNGPKSLPYAFDKDGMKPLHAAKSSPSLNDKFQTIVGQNQWWKTSMDSLRSGNEYRPDCYPSRGFQNRDSEQIKEAPVSHSHSNSDSGLSSLSGRTSCMSPMSVVSTGSSASSGSSRASLRSASIVSSTTIPLDEDDERDLSLSIGVKRNQSIFSKTYLEDESEINRMAAELFKVMPVDANVSSLFGSLGSQGKTTAQYLKGVFNFELEQVNSPHCKLGYTAIHSDQHSNDGINQTGNEDEETGLEGQKIVDAKKCELEGHIKKRLSSLKIEEASMKEKEKRNADIGKVLMKKLQIEGRQNEVDKYKLHVEEVDKITSLILGLSSRLAKSENALINLQKNWNEDEELSLRKKKEKLVEQLEEAKALKASIDKRSTIVSNILLQYLSESEYNQYRVFIRTKVHLLIDSRLITERKAAAQQQLDAIMLQKGDL